MPVLMLALVSLAELLGMTMWFSASAVTAPLSAAFDLTPGAAAWLTMAVQAGFVAGTLGSALLSLPDLMNPRRLFALGCVAGAAANTGVTLAGGAPALIACRFLTGLALAWVYPPGLKIAAGWTRRRRGTALGVVVGALTIGSAFPHLLSAVTAVVAWKTVVATASALAVAGGLVVLLAVRDGPYVAETSPFNPRAVVDVFASRGTRLATFGYLGHMWELYAMWTWFGAFATASLAAAGHARAAPLGSLAAFVAVASGAPGCVLAGLWADRLGKAQVAGGAMVLSGVCAASAGLLYGRPFPALLAFGAIWGVVVVADSAQFSALVVDYAPRAQVGTALTLQTCSGFLLTLLTIRLIPTAAEHLGWAWAFVLLVPGPALGAWAMRALAGGERPPIS
jgi:MFS family permease